MNRHLLGAVCLSLAAGIWGGTYVVSKYVLTYIPPFTLLWLRYAVALAVLGTAMVATGTYRVRRGDWGMLVWIGFVGYFLSIGAQFIGTRLTSAHQGALITSSAPAFIVIFAFLLLKERLTSRKIWAVITASAGVLVVIGFGSNGGGRLAGNLALLLAAVTWALLSVYAKKAGESYSALTITTYAVLFAFLFTTPVAAWEYSVTKPGAFPATMVWAGIFFLGIVSTALAFFLWNKGIYLLDAGIGSLFLFLQPLVGSFLGWLILRESLHWNFFAGGALILLAVGLVQLPLKKTAVRSLSPGGNGA